MTWMERWKVLAVWKKAALVLLIVALGSAVVLSVKPVYRYAKAWRAVSLVEQAIADQRRGDEAGALRKARAAYQLAPYHPGVVRGMARLYEGVHVLRADEFWRLLENHPQVGVEDRVAYADYLLRHGFMDRAGPLIMGLLELDPPPRGVRRLEGLYYARIGNHERAERALRRALEEEPDAETRLALARVLLAAGGGREAVDLLFESAQELDNGLEALRQLAGMVQLGQDDIRRVLTMLRDHADPKAALLAWELEMRLDPTASEQILLRAMERAQAQPVTEKLETGRWFNQRKQPGKTLELIGEEAAMARRDAFLVRADAMALENRWAELDEWLARRNVPLEPVVVHAFRARVAVAMENEPAAAAHWARALQEAARQPDYLWFMAGYAEKLGRVELAAACYQRLAGMTDHARTAYLAWLRLLERENLTRDMHMLLQHMASRYPNDAVVLNDFAHVSLLLGSDTVDALKIGESLVREQPQVAASRVTLALGLVRTGKGQEAWALFQGFPEKERWQSGWRVVGALAADAAGEKEAARELVEGLRLDNLKPEERALLRAAGLE